MVLFNETEAMLLLDLYLHYRSNPQNLTSGGVLLKMHARDELTRAMNKYFKREAPWTESQVTVKFKNLRSEYIELKWLAEQPGFQLDGKGLTDEWWGDIKARRPKVHAFKGKLPWPFYKKMAVIVGDLPATTHTTDSRSMQRISQLLSEMAADNGAGNTSTSHHVNSSSMRNGSATTSVTTNGSSAVTLTPMDLQSGRPQMPFQQMPMQGGQSILPVQLPAKRQRDGSSKRPRKRFAELTEEERGRQQSLVKSVEHGSKAAADMAKGFNELVSVFQQQAAKCAHLDEDSAEAHDERQILVSLSASLERSSQATAETAKGFRDLVTYFIQEAEDAGGATSTL